MYVYMFFRDGGSYRREPESKVKSIANQTARLSRVSARGRNPLTPKRQTVKCSQP